MKKIVFIITFILIMCACQSQDVPLRSLDEKVTLLFFYIDTCSDCKAFKTQAIPYLEETFGDDISIEMYDLDADETVSVYDQVIDSLVDFDESKYGMGPFYAIDGYFAKLGYTAGDEEEIANDIEKAVKQEELGYELEYLRFYYKEAQ